jgi:S1-C subfamily serine protease
MEELNKNQIVLLVLLVSFVTSIATGIVTVTLLQQAPAPVTQTINRVVERTIEKAVPGETKTATVIKEVPVIVTEEQLIVDVINAATPAMVRIADKNGLILGSGFLIGDNGLIATSDKIFPAGKGDPGDEYQIFLSQGRQANALIARSSAKRGVAILRLELATFKDDDNKPLPASSLTKLELADAEAAAGQTVVALGVGDNGSIAVAGGIVSGRFENTTDGASYLSTSAVNASNLGGALLNIKGKVIGLGRDAGAALTAKMIQETLAGLAQ